MDLTWFTHGFNLTLQIKCHRFITLLMGLTMAKNPIEIDGLPSGKRLHNYGKSPYLMGKTTISMAIFNSYFDITRGYLLKMVDLSKPPTRYHGYALVVPRLDRLTQPRVPGAQVVGLRLQGCLQPWKIRGRYAFYMVLYGFNCILWYSTPPFLYGIWQCVKTLYPCSSHQNSW